MIGRLLLLTVGLLLVFTTSHYIIGIVLVTLAIGDY